MILLLYVGDVFLTNDAKFIEETKKMISTEFEMKDLDMVHYFLGLEVW